MDSKNGTLQYSISSIESFVKVNTELRTSFASTKTKGLEFRLEQLKKLYWGIVDNERAITEALLLDLGKPISEIQSMELAWVKNDIVFAVNNLPQWIKDEYAPDMPLAIKLLLWPTIRKDPLGTVCIFGAFNAPLQLTLGPLIGAIAGGNCAVIKPSENAPSVAMIIGKIVEESLDASCYRCLQGTADAATALLELRWDKIFFTGNRTVGRSIAIKAAETLTPVTLELGGLNPAIVTKNANPALAAKRLLWAKASNAGQICTTQNYTLIHRDIRDAFIEGLRAAMQEFFPKGAKNSPEFARISTPAAFKRIVSLMQKTQGTKIMGGETDEASKFIEPTVYEVTNPSDPLMTEESFGPILPIMVFDTLDNAIAIANKVDPTPLALYPFGNASEVEEIFQRLQSGGASVNDGFIHSGLPTLAFGGVGKSGHGSYRGRASFDCFTHRRSYTTTPGWAERLIAFRYPSRTKSVITNSKPSFGRT